MSEEELDDVWAAINALREDIDELQEEQMSTQSQIDADTAALDQVSTDLAASVAAIQAELDTLAANNPGVNLTALNAKVAALDPAVKAVGTLVPTPGTPPPPPAEKLFAFSGDPTSPIDPAVWAPSTKTEPGGQKLYTLVPGASQPTDPAWTEYTGPTA